MMSRHRKSTACIQWTQLLATSCSRIKQQPRQSGFVAMFQKALCQWNPLSHIQCRTARLRRPLWLRTSFLLHTTAYRKLMTRSRHFLSMGWCTGRNASLPYASRQRGRPLQGQCPSHYDTSHRAHVLIHCPFWRWLSFAVAQSATASSSFTREPTLHPQLQSC